MTPPLPQPTPGAGITHGSICTIRVIVAQGPLPGHSDRRMWACHPAEGGLFPGLNPGMSSNAVCVPEEWLTLTGEQQAGLPFSIIDGKTGADLTEKWQASATDTVVKNGKRVKRNTVGLVAVTVPPTAKEGPVKGEERGEGKDGER